MLKSIVQKNTSIKWCFYVFNAGTPPLREKVYSQIVTWESISILKGKTFTVKTAFKNSSGEAHSTSHAMELFWIYGAFVAQHMLYDICGKVFGIRGQHIKTSYGMIIGA